MVYDRLATVEALSAGWARVLANAGAPGGDGVSVHVFAHQAEHALARLAQDLVHEHYRPGPVRRTSIPKRSGGARPLAIPCVRDRVVQSALHLLLEPVLEQTFSDSSFAYRPGRGVTQAIRRIQELHRDGFRHVVDADIRKFFEMVPHAPLLERLGEIVDDPRVPRLVALWLSQEEFARGLPQGSPISPILSNLYLDHLDDNLSGKGVRFVRFADDFVVLCRSPEIASNALSTVRRILSELGLELNVEKTRLIDFNRGFQFLGKLFVKSMVLAGVEDDRFDVASLPKDDELPSQLPSLPYGAPDPAAEPAQPEVTADTPELSPTDRGDALPAADWRPGQILAGERHSLSPVLRPLYLLTPGRRLGIRGEAFAVYEQEKLVLLLPPSRIGRIEIGPDTHVETEAMRQALAWDIELAFVTFGGKTLGALQSTPRHASWHIAQATAHADPHRCVELARTFADARMRNQRALLNRLNRRRKDEEVAEAATKIGRIALKLKLAQTVDAVRGVEGEAAARYWPALGRTMQNGFQLTKRQRQPPGSPADVLLSMAASTLTRDIEALLLRHGMHTGIAYLHSDRDLAAPLAWDVLEIFRAPLVEGLTVYAVNNGSITLDHFGRNDAGAWAIDPHGREKFIRTYEAWLNRPIKNHRTGGESVWRGLIEDDILTLRAALTENAAFLPYLMDY